MFGSGFCRRLAGGEDVGQGGAQDFVAALLALPPVVGVRGPGVSGDGGGDGGGPAVLRQREPGGDFVTLPVGELVVGGQQDADAAGTFAGEPQPQGNARVGGGSAG